MVGGVVVRGFMGRLVGLAGSGNSSDSGVRGNEAARQNEWCDRAKVGIVPMAPLATTQRVWIAASDGPARRELKAQRSVAGSP